EIASAREPDSPRASERDPDAGRIGAGTDGKVVLESPSVAIEDEIDAGIEIGVAHAGISKDVRPPVSGIGSEEVVRDGGAGIIGDRRDGSGSGESYNNGVAGTGILN